MGKSIGIDGCRSGWFAVVIEDDASWHTTCYNNINEFWKDHQDAETILIDIPIGLPEKGRREADLEGRKLLRSRRMSLFMTPVRKAVYATAYAQASELNQKATGKRISRQAWNISTKIREVDGFLRQTPKAVEIMHESHPELVFFGLLGEPLDYSKKKRQGITERLRILDRVYPQALDIYNSAVDIYRRRDVNYDDIVDALGLAVAAHLGNLRTIPANPPRDAHDLPMQIVYSPLPRIVRMHHVFITVPSDRLDEAHDFYTSILGLQEVPRPQSIKKFPGFWLRLANMDLHIGVQDDIDREAPLTHVAYQVSNIKHWRESLSQQGVEIREAPPLDGYLRFEFSDPFGNRIEMIQPKD